MTPCDLPAAFRLWGNALYVRGGLGADEYGILEDHLRKLLEVDAPVLVLELCEVTRMESGYVGLLAWAILTARDRGRVLRMRASGQVLRLLRNAGIDTGVTPRAIVYSEKPCGANRTGAAQEGSSHA